MGSQLEGIVVGTEKLREMHLIIFIMFLIYSFIKVQITWHL